MLVIRREKSVIRASGMHAHGAAHGNLHGPQDAFVRRHDEKLVIAAVGDQEIAGEGSGRRACSVASGVRAGSGCQQTGSQPERRDRNGKQM